MGICDETRSFYQLLKFLEVNKWSKHEQKLEFREGSGFFIKVFDG